MPRSPPATFEGAELRWSPAAVPVPPTWPGATWLPLVVVFAVVSGLLTGSELTVGAPVVTDAPVDGVRSLTAGPDLTVGGVVVAVVTAAAGALTAGAVVTVTVLAAKLGDALGAAAGAALTFAIAAADVGTGAAGVTGGVILAGLKRPAIAMALCASD